MSLDTMSETERAKIKKKMRDAKNKKKALSYEEFEKVFDLYDVDKNGRLQYCEINSFMKDLLLRIERTKKSFKKGLTENEMLEYSIEVASLIQKYDTDRSGTLDKKEVANILNVTIPVDEPYKLEKSVRHKSKMFEAEDAFDTCEEVMPGDICLDIADSEDQSFDGFHYGEEIPLTDITPDEAPKISTRRRDSDLFRRGAVKKKSMEVATVTEEEEDEDGGVTVLSVANPRVFKNKNKFKKLQPEEEEGELVLEANSRSRFKKKDNEPERTKEGLINEPSLAQSNSHAWKSLQNRTFSDWANVKLSENDSTYKITDLLSNLGDGILLPELTKAVLKRDLDYKKNAKLTFHKYENIRISLNMLQEAGCRISIDAAGDLVSGNEKLCLSFMKSLVSHFGSGSAVQKTIQPALVNVLSIMQGRMRYSTPSNSENHNKNQPIQKPKLKREDHVTEEPDRHQDDPVLKSYLNQQNSTGKRAGAKLSLCHNFKSALGTSILALDSTKPAEDSDTKKKTSQEDLQHAVTQSVTPKNVAEEADRKKFAPIQESLADKHSYRNAKTFEAGERRPISNLSFYKKLESTLGTVPTLDKEKNELKDDTQNRLNRKNDHITDTIKTPDGHLNTGEPNRKNFQPVMQSLVNRQNTLTKLEPALGSQQSLVNRQNTLTKLEPALGSQQSLVNRQNTLTKLEPALGSQQSLVNRQNTLTKLEPALGSQQSKAEQETTKVVDVEQKQRTDQTHLLRKEFSPVMSELKKESVTRLSHLETRTVSETHSRGKVTPNTHNAELLMRFKRRDSVGDMGTIKPSSLMIPQFKQNVVNGVAEIVSRVNKLIEDEYGKRINNLSTDWADGQVILLLTNRLCPGVLGLYQHEHPLVKIGVAFTALADQLDIKTEITPMDVHMSKCELANFKVFLSQVLWKDRSNDRYMKKFVRTPAIMKKEKEMRNVGMISANFELNKPKPLPEEPAPTPPPRTSRPVRSPTGTANQKLPPALRKFYQIKASTPVVENTLLSTIIPPTKPQRPKVIPKLPALDYPESLLSDSKSKLPSDDKCSSPIASRDPLLADAKPDLPTEAIDLPLEDDCVLTCVPRRRSHESDNLDTTQIKGGSKPDAMPSSQSSDLTNVASESPSLYNDTAEHEFTIEDDCRATPVSSLHGSAFGSTNFNKVRRGSLPSELAVEYYGIDKATLEDDLEEEEEEDDEDTVTGKRDEEEDTSSEDSKQEKLNMEHNKNVSELIANFISTELKLHHEEEEEPEGSAANTGSLKSSKKKLKVSFNDKVVFKEFTDELGYQLPETSTKDAKSPDDEEETNTDSDRDTVIFL